MKTGSLPIKAVFIPALRMTEPKKLMVVLHGRGDSAESYRVLQNELALPDLNYLLLNAPDSSGYGFSWYASAPHQLPGILRSRQLLEKTFDQLSLQNYLPENTVLFGFSQGCLMTIEFGSRYRAPLAGYYGMSGYVYDASAVLQESKPENRLRPWRITHGTQDDVLPIEETRQQIKELNEGGFKIDYLELEKEHCFLEPHDTHDLRNFLNRTLFG
jgi:phospholipase/carboxylesterase